MTEIAKLIEAAEWALGYCVVRPCDCGDCSACALRAALPAAKAELALLLEACRKAEWGGLTWDGLDVACPVCGMEKFIEGHATDCILSAALAKAGASTEPPVIEATEFGDGNVEASQ